MVLMMLKYVNGYRFITQKKLKIYKMDAAKVCV